MARTSSCMRRTVDERTRAWIGLNLVPLAPAARARLVQELGGPVEVLRATRERLQAVPGIRLEAVQKIVGLDWKSRAEAEALRSQQHGFQILTPDSDTYPPALLEICDPPPALYLQGGLLPQDEIAVAVVGSRDVTSYGARAAEELAAGLAERGVTVVSGLALGADSAAHRGALEAGGRTIAVLGSALDVPYPRRNRKLLERIAAKGAVLSEFPLGSQPLAWHFPQRNRVIAGLTQGTVVVEAAERSGSLITARLALEYGREVLAAPGPITSRRSVGANRMLRDGAGLALSAGDVIDALREDVRARLRPAAAQAAAPSRPDLWGLPEEEARVLAAVGEVEPLHVDEIAASTGLPAGRLLDILLTLELRGLIRPAPGGRYFRGGGSSVREPRTLYRAVV